MKTDRYGHCFYGVDYAVPPHELNASALADARNVYVNGKGLITGRGGTLRLNSTALGGGDKVLGGLEFRSGSTRRLFAAYNDGAGGAKIGYYDSGTGDFSEQITGLTEDKMWQFVNFGGKLIGVNEGADAPQYYTDDVTKGDLAGDPPSGLTICEWANRLWFGGDSTDVAKLTGSALNDPTDYAGGLGASDSFEQTVGDSKDQITGIFPFFDILLIGKKNNIYKLYSPDGITTDATSFSLDPLYSKSSDNAGFTSQWAIAQIGNDVIFLDGFDIKRLSGIETYGDVEYVSVIPQFRDFLAATCDADYLQYTQFFHYKKKQQLWVSMPTSATSYYVFCLDYKFITSTERFSVYPMYNITATCFIGEENGSVVDMYIGDTSGWVSQLDASSYDDNGSAISKYFVKMVSGNIISDDEDDTDLSVHHYRKDFIHNDAYIEVDTSGGASALSMVFSYAMDLFDDAQIRSSGNYTTLSTEAVAGWGGTGVKNKRLPLQLSGNTLSLKIANNTVAQNFIIHPSEITYKMKSKNKIT